MSLAVLGALVIGMTLGLLGSGGSIITVPILIFILQRPEKVAIAESLMIVGSVSLIGAIPYVFRSQVDWKSVLFFGLPGILGSCLGGYCTHFIVGTMQVVFFSLLMLIVATIMLSNQFVFARLHISHPSKGLIMLAGFLVGCLTGFVGIGGGFLIVPSLMILCNLAMPFAIGTSLIIIGMNAFTSFLEQLTVLKSLHLSVDWTLIVILSSIGMLGSLFGSLISHQIPQIILKKIFGLSVLGIGLYILITRL